VSSQTIDHIGLGKLWRLHPQRCVVLFVLLVAAAISSSVAIKEALVTGIDFQWSAAHLLDAGRDPWMTYLSGDKGHEIILGQQPNYLPELYELLMPLGAMQFSHALAWWCGINLLLLGLTLAMVCRLFKLDRFHAALAVLLILCSTPFRVTMSNGQHGIFILFLLTSLYYLSNSVCIGNADAEALRDFPSVAYSAIERAADCLEAFRWEPAYLGHRAAQDFKDRHGTG